jgi:hypothetical protein
MSNAAKISAECLTPILYVRDFKEAMNYYTEKLLFDRLWEWGEPPDFGAVRLGNVEIFFCLGGQGHPGTWLSIFMEDVDDYIQELKARHGIDYHTHASYRFVDKAKTG